MNTNLLLQNSTMKSMQRSNKLFSLGVVLAIYSVATLIGILIATYLYSDMGLLPTLLIVDVLATVIVFIGSVSFKNSSIYDPYWSVVPILLLAVLFYVFDYSLLEFSAQSILLWCVVFWGIRLTYNWAEGWKNLDHEDWRYSMLRKDNPKIAYFLDFSGIHMFPTLIVFLGLVPAFALFENGANDFGLIQFMGFLLFCIALFFETVGDNQLRAFKASNPPKGSLLTTGLWKYTRHPNYLGEMLFWWSIYLLSYHPDNPLWMIAGPVAITGLFVFISIPMMDKRMMERRSGYKEYRERTSALFPWPPKG